MSLVVPDVYDATAPHDAMALLFAESNRGQDVGDRKALMSRFWNVRSAVVTSIEFSNATWLRTEPYDRDCVLVV